MRSLNSRKNTAPLTLDQNKTLMWALGWENDSCIGRKLLTLRQAQNRAPNLSCPHLLNLYSYQSIVRGSGWFWASPCSRDWPAPHHWCWLCMGSSAYFIITTGSNKMQLSVNCTRESYKTFKSFLTRSPARVNIWTHDTWSRYIPRALQTGKCTAGTYPTSPTS